VSAAAAVIAVIRRDARLFMVVTASGAIRLPGLMADPLPQRVTGHLLRRSSGQQLCGRSDTAMGDFSDLADLASRLLGGA
jgi:hypothetical protein